MAAKSLFCVGGKMKPKICLSIEDGYADAYAFATLYNYLAEKDFPAEFVLQSRRKEAIEKFDQCTNAELFCLPTPEDGRKSGDIRISSYSDVSGYLDYFCDGEIVIDCSVLKNCTKPISEEERKLLRQKFKISEDKPTVVVGFPSFGTNYENLKIIVDKFKDSQIYFVGSIPIDFDEVKVIEARGVLKDYYALADVAMIGSRIYDGYNDCHLHNFVEATAGGPLFLTTQKNTQQYGYKELKDLGVIREAKDTEDIINKIKKYLENSNGEELRRLRNKHLEKSRELYLTDILRVLSNAIGISNELPQSNLLVDIDKKNFPSLRIRHPDTVWGDEYSLRFRATNISLIPQEVYEGFRRGR